MAIQQPIPKNLRFVDLTGKAFGRWTVLYFTGYGSGGNSTWLCQCECGMESVVRGPSLTKGTSNGGCASCYRSTHGKSTAPEYVVWQAMRGRCQPTHQSHEHYGSRGITVCERWLKFENFYADMGPRPSPKHSIDRIDNSGNYEPSNCRWATQSQQLRNTRRNHVLTFAGKTMCLADWAKEFGMPYNTLHGRLAAGWSVECALTTAVNSHLNGS